MGLLIVKLLGAIIIILIFVLAGVYFWRRSEKREARERGWSLKGDLNSREEREIVLENEAAADLLRALLAPPGSLAQLEHEEMTLLSRAHRQAVTEWLDLHSASTHVHIKRKVIGQ